MVSFNEFGPRVFANRRSLLVLCFGVVVGFTMAFLLVSTPNRNGDWMRYGDDHHHGSAHDPHSGNDLIDAVGPEQDVGFHGQHDEAHALENNSVATQLYNEVKVLCWIMTNPKNHQSKARHVKRTWGTRCNKILFMSSQKDDELDSIALPIGEGRENLWGKTKEAFKYIYENHFDDADWFMKADDDTYVIVENLRYMLYPYPSDEPLYFGCKFKPFVKQGYMSGGAGYVLSKEALRRFIENALPDKKICRSDNGGAEDVEMGKCLENVDVIAGDSRDSSGRGRMFPFVPEHHLIPGHVDPNYWYWNYIFYPSKEGLNCCSDNAVSFHYVSPNQMYVLDYLIYHLRPYGMVPHPQPLPPKKTMSDIIESLSTIQSQDTIYTKGSSTSTKNAIK